MAQNIEIKIKKNFFNEIYVPSLFNYEERFFVLQGGAGSGKSVFAVQRMVIKALNDKRKILVVRKVARTIKDSIYQLIVDTLVQFQIDSECMFNKTTLTIELPNGSIFLFRGMDDEAKIKSIVDITDILIEEATELTFDDFSQLDLRLRHRKAKNQEIVMMFNPVSKQNWTYKTFFQSDYPNTKILHTTYKDNHFLPKEYIATLEALERTNPAYYKIYALGEFATLDKLIFPNITIEHGLAEKLLNAKKVVGVDFGYSNDPTTGIEVHYDKAAKTLYITDELYGKGMMTKQIADGLREKGFNNYMITADCADPRLIAEIRQLGISIQPAKKGKDSVLFGITWLQANKIVVDSRCVKTIEEFQNYTWEKNKSTNEYFNTPIDAWNHCIDALRYAVEQYSTGSAVRTLDKAALGL